MPLEAVAEPELPEYISALRRGGWTIVAVEQERHSLLELTYILKPRFFFTRLLIIYIIDITITAVAVERKEHSLMKQKFFHIDILICKG